MSAEVASEMYQKKNVIDSKEQFPEIPSETIQKGEGLHPKKETSAAIAVTNGEKGNRGTLEAYQSSFLSDKSALNREDKRNEMITVGENGELKAKEETNVSVEMEKGAKANMDDMSSHVEVLENKELKAKEKRDDAKTIENKIGEWKVEEETSMPVEMENQAKANMDKQSKVVVLEKNEWKAEDKMGDAEIAEDRVGERAKEKSNETEKARVKVETLENNDKEVVLKNGKKEEGNSHLHGLNEVEKKALMDIRSKVEEAIIRKQIFDELIKTSREENETPKEKTERKDVETVQKQEAQKESEEETKSELPNKEETEIPTSEPDQIQKLTELESSESPKEIFLWDIPLLPSKGHDATDTILLNFLRARDFKVNEAFEMLKGTLKWRKHNKIDTILEEDFGDEFNNVAYMIGKDYKKQPVCYNVLGVFGDVKKFEQMMGTEEKRQKFIRWRIQLMEKGVKRLDLKPGGVNYLVQIIDLSNTPLPSRKDVRSTIKQLVTVLQDNYPESIAANVFLNVPFWFYAFAPILSPNLSQRTKSKFLYARPAKTHETLLKNVPGEQIPCQFGGLKRDNDIDFFDEDTAKELHIKSGYSETIEFPAPEIGKAMMWDVCVAGGEVSYKEEFIPTDENSYTIIVKKERKLGSLEQRSLRNSFKVKEPGKISIFIYNASFRKKRLLYRYKFIK